MTAVPKRKPRGRPFRRTFWTPERQAQLVELVEAGECGEVIAKRLGARCRQAVATEARRLGHPIRRKAPRLKPRPAPVVPDILPLVHEAVATDPAAARPHNATPIAWPLHLAAYVLNVELGLSMGVAAKAIGRDPRGLGNHAIPRMEDRRDQDPALDALLERLGERAREMAA